MKKIGIVINPKKKGAAQLLQKLQPWLKKRKIEVKTSVDHSVPALSRGAALILCLGGDGTILSVARQLESKQIPILGVNLGHLGFLTEVKDEEVFQTLESFFKGKSKTEDRIMLSCAAKGKKGAAKKMTAFNDMVVSREGLTKLLQIEVYVSGEKLTSFRGDGLIVATPTGSTAYSLSAGGAIVHPQLEALIITPICPHASSLRPLVVRADVTVDVKIRTPAKGEKALLTADGQESLEIDDSYTVHITRADKPVRLLKNSKRDYIATLRENFSFPHE